MESLKLTLSIIQDTLKMQRSDINNLKDNQDAATTTSSSSNSGLSVTTASSASAGGSLSVSNGVFTFTPADTSGTPSQSTLVSTLAGADLSVDKLSLTSTSTASNFASKINITDTTPATIDVTYTSSGATFSNHIAALNVSGGVIIQAPETTADTIGAAVRKYALFVEEGETYFGGEFEVMKDVTLFGGDIKLGAGQYGNIFTRATSGNNIIGFPTIDAHARKIQVDHGQGLNFDETTGSLANTAFGETLAKITCGLENTNGGVLEIYTSPNGSTTVDKRFSFNSFGALGIGSSPDYGTDGYVLKSKGASVPPEWAAAGGSSIAARQYAILPGDAQDINLTNGTVYRFGAVTAADYANVAFLSHTGLVLSKANSTGNYQQNGYFKIPETGYYVIYGQIMLNIGIDTVSLYIKKIDGSTTTTIGYKVRDGAASSANLQTYSYGITTSAYLATNHEIAFDFSVSQGSNTRIVAPGSDTNSNVFHFYKI